MTRDALYRYIFIVLLFIDFGGNLFIHIVIFYREVVLKVPLMMHTVNLAYFLYSYC